MKTKAYQPKTGAKCHCKRGVERDNCPDCEGTGQRIDFKKIREATPKTQPAKEEDHRSENQAKAQFDSIKTKVERLDHCQHCKGDCDLDDAAIKAGLNIYHKPGHPTHGRPASKEDRAQYHNEDEARERIQEDPLSVEVRSDWHRPGDAATLGEYLILLCTGGPACRIIGELSEHGEPTTARLEHQDWFTPWTEYRLDSEEEAILLRYANCFYFAL